MGEGGRGRQGHGESRSHEEAPGEAGKASRHDGGLEQKSRRAGDLDSLAGFARAIQSRDSLARFTCDIVSASRSAT
ncbi:hypothetical protein BSU04_42205 [Caballeronia sordidicola]|uniref:Uncharacterized protein n=1 Tax=Caballeronia sordidicola TaxID=196367 RepID=A0A226WN49_CABSO|nr:hypothetical protein BSU04_42205 [Caballeronia sordidicola]